MNEELAPGVGRAPLEAWLGERVGAKVTVDSLRLASQGMSDDTLFVAATADGGERHDLVVRRYRGLVEEISDCERQFRVLRALADGDVPVAAVLWLEPDAEVLGGPFFVMERVAGEVPVPWSPEGREFLARAGRGPIGEQFVEILAAIHGLATDGRDLGFLADERPVDAEAHLDEMEAMVRRYRREPEPIVADALGWLRSHLPDCSEVTLVHGDYRTGNMIFADDRIVAVLDWEFTRLGDPMIDVAWVLARSNRMDSPLACYLLEPERFVEAYESLSDRAVDMAAVRFWELYHQVFNAMVWMSAEQAIGSERSDDLRLLRWSYTLPVMRSLVAEALEAAER